MATVKTLKKKKLKRRLEALVDSMSFDDVLLVPAYSEVVPNEIDVSSSVTIGDIDHPDSKELKLSAPIMSAAMDTVTGASMAAAMLSFGCIPVLHRNCTIDYQREMIKLTKDLLGSSINDTMLNNLAVAIGVNDKDRIQMLLEEDVRLLIIDVSHGHSKNVGDTIKMIKDVNENFIVVAGNVVTQDGAGYLDECGADLIKVGIGSGSSCTTRAVTGIGVPQITALQNAVVATDKPIICDGGVAGLSDIIKALAIGADVVMLGRLLAGTSESEGYICLGDGTPAHWLEDEEVFAVVDDNGTYYEIDENEPLFCYYRGMGSDAAMNDGHATDRYHGATNITKHIAEGVEGLVPYIGSSFMILQDIVSAMQSAFGYAGANNIDEFRKNITWVKLTSAGIAESHVNIDIV